MTENMKNSSPDEYLEGIGRRAKAAAAVMSVQSTQAKNDALHQIADALEANAPAVLDANTLDIKAAQQGGYKASFIERMTLSEGKIKAVADSVRYVAGLEDPVGRVLWGTTRPNGLKIKKISVPMGVVGMIYESRPNVTVDAGVLCIKSGNACILRGGKETIRSNKILADIMRSALSGITGDALILIEETDREYANALMRCASYVDVLIPRGSAGLIDAVVQHSTVPVIETGAGNCHIFVDESADFAMALDIADNAKNSRPSVCNAAETILVHSKIAAQFLPQLQERMAARPTLLRCCEASLSILGTADGAEAASEEDFYTEYNDYILAVKIVGDTQEAIAHINKYSTHHSDSIITNDYTNAQAFTQRTDSAAVYVNASTRFTDGGEFGFGAEIGISTQKLHCRGPMGMEALTTQKYIIEGSGQIR